MLYLLQALSFWMMGAVGLGLLVGMLSWKANAEGEKPGLWLGFLLFALPLAVGATVAWLRWLPGRYGLWLETALLLLGVYLVGCGLGCLARGGFTRRGTRTKTTAVGENWTKPPIVPTEVTLEAETLALSAAALAAVAPAALDALGAARELLTETEAETEVAGDALLLPAPAPAPAPVPAPAPAPATPPLAERAEDDDHLRLIQGVDEGVEQRLHDLGVRRFDQIAAWTPEQQQGFGEKLGLGPRALRFLVAQARLLAGGVEPEFARALRRGEIFRATPEAPLDEVAAENLLAALPQPIALHANDEIYAGLRPLALLLPPYDEKDDLCQIWGVDPATAQKLNALGVWTHSQIARWSDDHARWIGSYLALPSRVADENWIAQARELANDGDAA